MIFLGHFYYFSGLLLLLANLGIILKFDKISKNKKWFESFMKVTKKRPEKGDMPAEDYQQLMSFNSVMLANFFWLFFGLISQSWKSFLLTLCLILIFNFLINLFNQIKIVEKTLNFLKLTITTFMIGALVTNHFHLHLNLFEELKTFFFNLF